MSLASLQRCCHATRFSATLLGCWTWCRYNEACPKLEQGGSMRVAGDSARNFSYYWVHIWSNLSECTIARYAFAKRSSKADFKQGSYNVIHWLWWTLRNLLFKICFVSLSRDVGGYLPAEICLLLSNIQTFGALFVNGLYLLNARTLECWKTR